MAPPLPRAKALSELVYHPSVWLVVPTILLLLGQAAASFASGVPAKAGFLALAPLFLCLTAKTRRWGILLFAGALAFGTGFLRHRQLIDPALPPNHLRSLMNVPGPLHIEGTLLQEPEKLPDRSRWIVAAERIWHPAGAQEITGHLIVTVRVVRREWRYGDRVRFKAPARASA